MTSFNNYRQNGFTVISNALLRNYASLNLSEIELVVLLQLESFAQKNNFFPSNQELAGVTNLSAIEISELLQGLINKQLISLEQGNDQQGRISNFYDLSPLYERLDKLVAEQIPAKDPSQHHLVKEQATDPIQMLVRQFEIEFGRLLSPIERQEVAAWINVDHYDPEIVKMALRESILAQVYNFKYVDRILLNWQRHSLRTPEQVKNFLQRNV